MLGSLGREHVGRERHLQDFVFGQGVFATAIPDIDGDGVIVGVIDEHCWDPSQTQSLTNVVAMVSIEDGSSHPIYEQG